jgi:hypothetical protein
MDNKNKLLRGVRNIQQYCAICAEILLLLAFFTSGMDVSLGGTMAGLDVFKWTWAFVFALGIDTSFVLSWVRCKQIGKSKHLWWAIPLAVCMSIIVFQPLAIQLLQQSLGISFNQALSYLGINIVELVYARAFVAVCLGGILALTNSEHPIQESEQGYTPTEIIEEEAPYTPLEIEQECTPLIGVDTGVYTCEQKIRQLLENDCTLSARSLAKQAECTPATASKWQKRILSERITK